MHMSTCESQLIQQVLRFIAVTASAIWIPIHCSIATAQLSPPGSNAEAEPPSEEQVRPAEKLLLEQLARQIESLRTELQKNKNPQAAQVQQQLDEMLALQKHSQQRLSNGPLRMEELSDLAKATGYIMRTQREQTPELAQLRQLQEQFAQQQKLLAEREKQYAILLSEQRRVPLPPLENGTMKLYKLKFVPAHAAAQTVESLFGAQALRLAVDERGNTLIAYSKPESIAALDSLVSRLDEQAAAAADPDKSTKNNAALPRSLMIRVFWLADGVPQTFGQNPADFLPASVLAATAKLGLESPRLVVQTVSSLATGKEDTVEFSTSVPAALFEQAVVMNCGGKLKLVSDDRVRVDMNAHVVGDTTSCDLIGSMATPLGHYMVLGTANSRFAQGGMAAGAMPGGEMGMAGPAGPGGFQPGTTPRRGRSEAAPGGEFGGPAADPTTGMPGDPSGMPAQRSFTTSRFAFVVQVVEGKSYEAEKLGQPESK